MAASKAKAGWAALATHEPISPDRSEAPSASTSWIPFDGSERIITGDLENLADGDPVQIGEDRDKAQIASAR